MEFYTIPVNNHLLFSQFFASCRLASTFFLFAHAYYFVMLPRKKVNKKDQFKKDN
jgi:hypothetical protein